MNHADTLAALRKPGRTDDQYRECLEALVSTLHATDPVCVAIDTAIREIEDYEESMAAIAQMRADDLDNERSRHLDRGEYDAQTVRVPNFLMEVTG